ncbi:polysaccharide biosynthesis protein [Wenyingzhuangia sp. IMCC45467]
MEISEILKDQFDESLGIKNTEYFKGKVVLITGAAGSIGQKLALILLKTEVKKVALLDNSEAQLFQIQQILKTKEYFNFSIELVDVACEKTITAVFKKHQPEIVYHAAAYKHVPLLEDFPFQAFKVNVLGTKNVLNAALIFKTQDFIFISTDKAVYPKSVMGYTKRLAEIYTSQFIKEKHTNIKILRLGNIPNSMGSIIPLWKTQLALTGRIQVVDEEVSRYFISLTEVCKLLLEIVNVSSDSLFVAQMGEPVSIYKMSISFLKKYKKDESDIITIKSRPGDKIREFLFYKNENIKPLKGLNCLSGNLKVSSQSIACLNELFFKVEGLSEEKLKKELKKIAIEGTLLGT